jgi:hypothetical protein
MELEGAKSLSVVDVAAVFEKLAQRRIFDLRVDRPVSAVGASYLQFLKQTNG